MNTRYSCEIEEYKKFAEARRARRKWTQEKLGEVYSAIAEYVEEATASRKPLTIAGMILAAHTDRQTWTRWRDGDMDYILEEYIANNELNDNNIVVEDGIPLHIRTDAHDGSPENEHCYAVMLMPYSEMVAKCELLIQQQLEENCYTNRGNPAGSIFGLKARFAWREDDAPTHVSQTLVLADVEQARKALGMLTNG